MIVRQPSIKGFDFRGFGDANDDNYNSPGDISPEGFQYTYPGAWDDTRILWTHGWDKPFSQWSEDEKNSWYGFYNDAIRRITYPPDERRSVNHYLYTAIVGRFTNVNGVPLVPISWWPPEAQSMRNNDVAYYAAHRITSSGGLIKALANPVNYLNPVAMVAAVGKEVGIKSAPLDILRASTPLSTPTIENKELKTIAQTGYVLAGAIGTGMMLSAAIAPAGASAGGSGGIASVGASGGYATVPELASPFAVAAPSTEISSGYLMTSVAALPSVPAASGGAGALSTVYQGVNYLKKGTAYLNTAKTIAAKTGLLPGSKTRPASINEQAAPPQPQPETNPVVPLVVIGIIAKLLLF